VRDKCITCFNIGVRRVVVLPLVPMKMSEHGILQLIFLFLECLKVYATLHLVEISALLHQTSEVIPCYSL
jgi:hypothetical protein